MLTSKPLLSWFSYQIPSQNVVKKMFCVKKVTKLPDLTVFGWFSELRDIEAKRREGAYVTSCFPFLYYWFTQSKPAPLSHIHSCTLIPTFLPFQLQSSRNWPGPGKSSSVIWWRGKVILLNLKRGCDETSCLKSFSGDKQFRLVVSRNSPGPGMSSSGDWKIPVSDFGWTKSSQKSLSLNKLFYAPVVRLYH